MDRAQRRRAQAATLGAALVVLGVFAAVGCVESQWLVLRQEHSPQDGWFSSLARRVLLDEAEPDDALAKMDEAIAAKKLLVSALQKENEELKAKQEEIRRQVQRTQVHHHHHHRRQTQVVEKRKFVRFHSAAAMCDLSLGREVGDDWMRCERDLTDGEALGSIFELRPASSPAGAVSMRSAATGRLIEMVPPGEPEAWVLRASASDEGSPRTTFELVDGGYLINMATRACITVMRGATGKVSLVRGHGNKPNNKMAATKESMSVFNWQWLEAREVAAAREAAAQSAEKVANAVAHSRSKFINTTLVNAEKRVISYGLYGTNPKYTTGAIRNSELVHTVFPGWVTRFYVRSDVPAEVIDKLRQNGAEIVHMGSDAASGKIAGMFWRFLVADDPSVDRFLVRDSDSRLNEREAAAVAEWIESGAKVHTVRDHPNHDRPLNGGLWGGVKQCVPGIAKHIQKFANRGHYGGDLQFLTSAVWPTIKHDQLGHDAYTCFKYPNTRPFPTKRPPNFQHVGQVFDENDKPRMADINGFIRNRPIPRECRKYPDWKFG